MREGKIFPLDQLEGTARRVTFGRLRQITLGTFARYSRELQVVTYISKFRKDFHCFKNFCSQETCELGCRCCSSIKSHQQLLPKLAQIQPQASKEKTNSTTFNSSRCSALCPSLIVLGGQSFVQAICVRCGGFQFRSNSLKKPHSTPSLVFLQILESFPQLLDLIEGI